MRLPLVLTGLAACLLLASCADKTSHQAAPTTSAHDWRDATYTITCDGVVPDGFSAALHDGVAKVPADIGQTQFYDDFEIRLEATATGDLDGDGRSDTVVLLQCSPQPSNGIVEEVQVFDADDHLIAELPSPRTLRQADVLPPVYDPNGLKVVNGEIVAAMKIYLPGDTHAGGPSGQQTFRWQWDGKHFEQLP
jgi:hypothetical protein